MFLAFGGVAIVLLFSNECIACIAKICILSFVNFGYGLFQKSSEMFKDVEFSFLHSTFL